MAYSMAAYANVRPTCVDVRPTWGMVGHHGLPFLKYYFALCIVIQDTGNTHTEVVGVDTCMVCPFTALFATLCSM